MTDITVLRRAAFDIDEIEISSVHKWGQQAADAYLDSIDETFQMLSERPGLLREFEHSSHLFTCPVRDHTLFCTQHDGVIYVLTILYGSMDRVYIIPQLEPVLLEEIEVMHKRLRASRK